jgi:hypothetical protein
MGLLGGNFQLGGPPVPPNPTPIPTSSVVNLNDPLGTDVSCFPDYDPLGTLVSGSSRSASGSRGG